MHCLIMYQIFIIMDFKMLIYNEIKNPPLMVDFYKTVCM